MPRATKDSRTANSATGALASGNGYASVDSLPKVNSAKLTRENRVYIHPVCALSNDRYMVSEGWKLIGWSDAPWSSAIGPHAIVYEKLGASDTDSYDSHAHFEPGLYWGHGDAKKMQFCSTLPAELEDELGPWVRKHNAKLSDSASTTQTQIEAQKYE